MGPGGPALCPLCPATHSSPLGRILPLKEFSFCDQKVTDAEPLVEGPELVTPRDLSGSPPPTGTAWMAPPTAPAWSPPGPLPDPRAPSLTASVLLGPWPTLLQGGWGGCISAPSAFWGPNPFSLVHEYLPGSENFHLVLSFHELPLHSCPFLPCSTRGTRWKPTGHPHTPRLQPAQGPHSELSLGRPVPPPPLGAPHDQWVHPTRISSQTAFPQAPAADVQAFPAGPQTPPTVITPPAPPPPSCLE